MLNKDKDNINQMEKNVLTLIGLLTKEEEKNKKLTLANEKLKKENNELDNLGKDLYRYLRNHIPLVSGERETCYRGEAKWGT